MTLEDIEKLCNKATPGPWTYDYGNHQIESNNEDYWRSPICNEIQNSERDDHHKEFNLLSKLICPDSDMEFIAMARTALPKLLALARAAKELDTYMSLEPDLTVPGKFRAASEGLIARHNLITALKELEKSKLKRTMQE